MRKMLIGCLAVSLLCVVASTSYAGPILRSNLFPGGNTLQDQSVEVVFDVVPDGIFGVGDVVAGFVRIDNNITPPGSALNDEIYGVFSNQVVASLETPLGGGSSIYSLSFAPTVAGTIDPITGNSLTLAGLTGLGAAAPPALALGGDGAMAAVFELAGGFGNLVTNPPPGGAATTAPAGTLDLFDFTTFISSSSGSTPDFVAGFANVGKPVALGPDFASALTSVLPSGGIPIAALTASTTGTTIASFAQGLSIITNFDPLIQYNQVVMVNSPSGIPPGFSTVDVGIALGGLTGSVNAPIGSFTPTLRNAQQFIVDVTIVPEPGSVFAWGGSFLLLAGIGVVRRRKSKAVA